MGSELRGSVLVCERGCERTECGAIQRAGGDGEVVAERPGAWGARDGGHGRRASFAGWRRDFAEGRKRGGRRGGDGVRVGGGGAGGGKHRRRRIHAGSHGGWADK